MNKKNLQNYHIARFALTKKFEDINIDQCDLLKRHLLDSMASFIYAERKPTVAKLVRQINSLSHGGECKGPFGDLPVDRAAQLYTALIRYPDFMDNYMGKEATCHPSDNIGSLLAAAQLVPTSGKDFLTAMAVSYQIECRLVEEIPVMSEGIDHTLFLGYSIVGGLASILRLTEDETANALGIAGSSISPMVTSRASYTFEWKGFASSLEALNCMNIILLAKEGMTGPVALFEGPKGFKEIFDMKLEYNWEKEGFELLQKCSLKSYNAEVHSQAAIEAILEIRKENTFNPLEVEEVIITTFLTAYHIIGSGAYGDRKEVHSKEQADHSLFYLSAIALLDGQVYPEQFEPERIQRDDVQNLLQKVQVKTGFPLHKPIKVAGLLDPYTEAYPDKMKTKVEIKLKNGKTFTKEKNDYSGFYSRPLSWQLIIEKFNRITSEINTQRQKDIIDFIQNLEKQEAIEPLIKLLFDKE
jgi:2-methylcitrate dehydratase